MVSWECIPRFGRFIEIGKQDILSNSSLSMSSYEKIASFHALDVSVCMKERSKFIRGVIAQIIEKDVIDTRRSGVFRWALRSYPLHPSTN